MDVECQCGTVHFKTPTEKPEALYYCHCLECRKQSFTSEGLVPLSEELDNAMGTWSRTGTESGGLMDCYFCKNCGTRVLHRTRDESGSERGIVSIKGGCVEGLNWEGGIHIFTRSAVVPIPEGAKQFEGSPS